MVFLDLYILININFHNKYLNTGFYIQFSKLILFIYSLVKEYKKRASLTN